MKTFTIQPYLHAPYHKRRDVGFNEVPGQMEAED